MSSINSKVLKWYSDHKTLSEFLDWYVDYYNSIPVDIDERNKRISEYLNIKL